MSRTARKSDRPTARSAFTLTELLIAVAVLIGVLLGVSKIFSTTSRVAAVGEATSDLLAESSVIERQLRRDFASLSADGFFAIRCRWVRNDINGQNHLHPSRPGDARIRSDQLVYFTTTVEPVQSLSGGVGIGALAAGAATRVYFGHGFQLGDGGRGADTQQSPILAKDPALGSVLAPWLVGEVGMQNTQFGYANIDGNDMFRRRQGFTSQVAQTPVRQWALVRQPVALIDDDRGARGTNNKTVFYDRVITARSIFLDDPEIGLSPQVYHGRVDAAATQLHTVRRLVTTIPATGAPRPWVGGFGGGSSQYEMISEQLLYGPRAERRAPSMNRVDQALTNHVLGTACSEVRIEWTYGAGVGAVRDQNDAVVFNGFPLDPEDEGEFAQPWFGPLDAEFGVEPYADYFDRIEPSSYAADMTIDPARIERFDAPGTTPLETYEAIFGFNNDRPVDDQFNVRSDYTPWPTAIRITLTLHDSRSVLEAGREVQIILDLPRRTSDAR